MKNDRYLGEDTGGLFSCLFFRRLRRFCFSVLYLYFRISYAISCFSHSMKIAARPQRSGTIIESIMWNIKSMKMLISMISTSFHIWQEGFFLFQVLLRGLIKPPTVLVSLYRVEDKKVQKICFACIIYEIQFLIFSKQKTF